MKKYLSILAFSALFLAAPFSLALVGDQALISLAPGSVGQTVHAGDPNVEWLSFTVECDAVSDCELKGLVVNGYLDDSGDLSAMANKRSLTDHRTSLNDYISDLKLVDESGSVIDVAIHGYSNFNYRYYRDYVIPAGQTETFFLKGKLQRSAFQNNDAENIAFSIVSPTNLQVRDWNNDPIAVNGTVNFNRSVVMTTAR